MYTHQSIITYPHPLLTTKQEYDPGLDDYEIIAQMLMVCIQYANNAGDGLLGLAANQIGIETRILLYRDEYNEYLTPLIDPVIDFYGDLYMVDLEACGSFPGLVLEVPRATYIVVKHKDGRTAFRDQDARIIQHEVDHLDGITFLHREV